MNDLSSVYEVIIKAQNGDKKAQEQIVASNEGLVRSIAGKLYQEPYDFEDLLQVGYIGLIKAVKAFNTDYGVRFSTYAVPVIMGEIKQYIRDSNPVKMSRKLKADIKRLKSTEEEFWKKNERCPKISELSEELSLSCEEVLEIKEAEKAMSLSQMPEDSEFSSDWDKDNHIDIIQLKEIICSLPKLERQIIVLRYFKDMTQQQVAKIVGISQVQVSRTEKRVLLSMKREMEAD